MLTALAVKGFLWRRLTGERRNRIPNVHTQVPHDQPAALAVPHCSSSQKLVDQNHRLVIASPVGVTLEAQLPKGRFHALFQLFVFGLRLQQPLLKLLGLEYRLFQPLL